jgi:hypothetical protein
MEGDMADTDKFMEAGLGRMAGRRGDELLPVMMLGRWMGPGELGP